MGRRGETEAAPVTPGLEGQNRSWGLPAVPDSDSVSYLEAYFKKYWILSGQSVKQKKLSLPVMLLEYKKHVCTGA